MVTRESIMVFKDQGTEGVTGRVISLAEALDKQKRRAAELSPILKNTTVDTHAFGSIAQSSSAKITSLTNTLGPLGAGLGAVSRAGPQAAMGLLALCAAQEKASLLQRSLNVALMGGAATMITGAITVAAYADEALRAGDTYASLQARIRTFADGNMEAARTQRELYAAAKDARVGVGDLTTLYTRLTPAVEDYGRSQKDALAITQLTSKALAIQGADIREQAAATIQFSQSIASGVMRGDELRSLLESSPQLLRYIAQNLEINGKVGVAFSSLRKLGEEGALTTERIIDALLRAGPKIEADFINAPKLSQQGWKILMDTIVHTVGEMDKAVGGQKAVVTWLNEMANKADAWREKMLMDPASLDPIKDAAAFVGDLAGSIGTLGKVAVDNFDMVVGAGQAIIALKLGSIMANWFASAATGAQALIAKLEDFKAAAQVKAATTAMPNEVKAAQALRAAATAADLRAAELRTAAEIKQAQAVAARTAAYEAGNAVNRVKIQLDQAGAAAGQREAAITAAQAEAATLSAAATKAEAQAKTAATAASNAAAAATTRNTVAKAAETVVTVELTAAQIASNAAKAAGLALYNLLGGAIGLATLAIGGLVYAVWKAHEAEKARYDAMRQSVDITDRLKASTDAMAAATWAEIPGILAKNKALRDQAAAQREVQAGQMKDKQAQLADLKEQLKTPGSAEAAQGLMGAIARLEREIKARGGVIADGQRSAAAERDQAYQERLITAAKEKGEAQRQISRGTDDGGRPLTAARTEELKAVVEQKTTYLRAQVDKLNADIAIVDAKSATADKDAKLGLSSLRTNLGSLKDIASEGAIAGGLAAKPSPAATKPKAVAVPGGVSAAYSDLLKAGFLNLTGGEGFAASNGSVTRNGAEVVARSDDEAAALTRYVKVVEALNDATDAQIKKEAEKLGVTGRSKEEMKAAAGAILEREMSTSKAAQADERWNDIQAQMSGESRSRIAAERMIYNLRQDGIKITDTAADAFIGWTVAKQKAEDLQKGLQVSAPLVQRGFDTALAGKVTPVDARGVLDEAKATEQLMEAKAAVVLDRDRAVREEIERRLRSGELTEQEVSKETTDAKAAYDIAVEIATQDQLLAIRKDRLKENLQAQEQQIAETSDAIIGALRDIKPGNIEDVGKRLGNELLSAFYEELMFSPLRQQIQDTIRNLVATRGGSGGGGIFGILGKAALGALGVVGGFNASAAASQAAQLGTINPSLDAGFTRYPGSLPPGYADGRVQASQVQNLIFRGRGGPRGDDNLVRISDGEAIINAEATSMSSRILHLVNTGKINDSFLGFATGRVPGGSLSAGPVVSYAPRREGDVILNNMTGMAATATRRTDERGNTHIDLKPLADQMARQAGQSGALKRGLQQSPQPTKRA